MVAPEGFTLTMLPGMRVGMLEHVITGQRFSMTAPYTPAKETLLRTISQAQINGMAGLALRQIERQKRELDANPAARNTETLIERTQGGLTWWTYPQ